MKITIIGAGNMGGATALGLARSGKVPPANITVTAAHQASLQKYSESGIQTTLNNAAAVQGADVVILAVKPWVAPGVISEIRPQLDLKHQLFLTMMPGITATDLTAMLQADSPVTPSLLYVIPNTAIEVGESITFVAPCHATPAQTRLVVSLFEPMGPVMEVDYPHLSACTALASCGIAFALRYIRASTEGGVQLGVKASVAQQIVAQTVRGAAALLQANGTHAEHEIDRVTTPGGITIRGLNAMEHEGFTAAVIAGLLESGRGC